jgi:hypothetical protein
MNAYLQIRICKTILIINELIPFVYYYYKWYNCHDVKKGVHYNSSTYR